MRSSLDTSRSADGHSAERASSRIAGIVLCGGESRRMGRPKLSLPFGPTSLLTRVVHTLRDVVEPVVVVAAVGQHLPDDLPASTIVARDEQPGRGPLGGLAAGFARLPENTEAAFVSACDVPLLSPEFVRRMIELLETAEMAILRDGKHYHPLAAVYRTELESRVRTLLANDRLRPFFLVESSQARVIDAEELRAVDPSLNSLRNVNTPAEYEAALHDAGFSLPSSGGGACPTLYC